MLIQFLAQVSPVSPTPTPTATAFASVTPTPTPTPTPAVHVVVDQPFWNSGLGILLLILIFIGIGIVIGVIVGKGGTNGLVGKVLNVFNDFTNILAYMVLVLAFGGILLLSSHVLGAATDKDRLEVAKYVFSAVLPLLGTWVGAVLAHYFQKENLAAATQSISDLASKVGGADKLQSTPATNVMIKADQIETLPPECIGKKSGDILLSDLIKHLAKIQKDRLPLFKDAQDTYQKTGPAAGVVHLSTIEKFTSNYTLNPPSQNKKEVKDLSLGDLNSHPDYPQFKSVFENSFGLVPENATLGRAKTIMDNLSQKIPPEIKAGCYDVFLTKTGDAKESVLGWITNDLINQNAKV